MIITNVEKLADLLVITTDASDIYLPVFLLHEVANGSTVASKTLDMLRAILSNPESPVDDPYIEKFAHLKTELTGLDIGEL